MKQYRQQTIENNQKVLIKLMKKDILEITLVDGTSIDLKNFIDGDWYVIGKISKTQSIEEK